MSAAEPDGLAALRETAKADDGLDRMIGQTIMVGFSGRERARSLASRPCATSSPRASIGGVVLYPENISSAAAAPPPHRLSSRNANSTLVPFIAVDQEGGRVQRLDRRTGLHALPLGAEAGAAMRR